ncbi:MAG: AMP-binding protein, partial [Hyphomicrobiales bacterium]|nr:AMP-binding protein [Hyphomicrobiales bacterium]
MDIATWIDRHAVFTPEKTAIRFAGADISYVALAERINRIAAALVDQLNVRKGDRVAHLGFNSPDMLALVFACARLGAVFVPINWRLAAPEIAGILSDCTPSALFVGPGFEAIVDDNGFDHRNASLVALPDARPGTQKSWYRLDDLTAATAGSPANDNAGPDDPILIVYTSGT